MKAANIITHNIVHSTVNHHIQPSLPTADNIDSPTSGHYKYSVCIYLYDHRNETLVRARVV